MNTSVPLVTVTTCECDFRTGKSFGWTIFFGVDILVPQRMLLRIEDRSIHKKESQSLSLSNWEIEGKGDAVD